MARKQVDWELIEREYRAGQLSVRALAEKHGVSHPAISKRAKAGNWVRNATAEVRERTQAALIAGQDLEEVTSGNRKVTTPTPDTIEVAVQTNLAVIGRHRRDIGHGHRLVGLLFSQLEEAALHREEIEDEIERECVGDETTARRTRMLKAVSLPSHAGVIRDLSTALKNLIPLERQAYNLDEVSSEESFEERLARLVGEK